MRVETWRTDSGAHWAVAVAESRLERRRGLLALDGLPPRGGLALYRARSVHTFAMRFAIDVAVLDDHLVVLGVLTVPPGRLVLPRAAGRHILEAAAGSGLRRGERFVVQATSSTSPDSRTTTVRGVSDGAAVRIASAARPR